MMMQMMGSGQNVTGSINLFSTISNAIENQVKVSLAKPHQQQKALWAITLMPWPLTSGWPMDI